MGQVHGKHLINVSYYSGEFSWVHSSLSPPCRRLSVLSCDSFIPPWGGRIAASQRCPWSIPQACQSVRLQGKEELSLHVELRWLINWPYNNNIILDCPVGAIVIIRVLKRWKREEEKARGTWHEKRLKWPLLALKMEEGVTSQGTGQALEAGRVKRQILPYNFGANPADTSAGETHLAQWDPFPDFGLPEPQGNKCMLV